MDRKQLIALMEKLGIVFLKKITKPKAEVKIVDFLENNDVPEGVKFDQHENAFLKENGFDMEGAGNDDQRTKEDKQEAAEDETPDNKTKEKSKKKTKSKKTKKDKKTKKTKKDKKTKSKKTKKDKKTKKTKGPKTPGKVETVVKIATAYINKSKNGKTRKELIAHISKEAPHIAEGTIRAQISRGKNKTSNKFHALLVECPESKKYSFNK